MNKDVLKLYAITDRAWLGEETLAQQVEKALIGGATIVQIREKNLSEDAFEKEALEVQRVCKQYQVPLIINDNVALAKRIDADGVHIGQSDMEIRQAREVLGADKMIGVTAKTVEQAKQAEAAGADYLGSGAVFGTTTKLDAKPMEHALLQEICESVAIPVVAIGGIDEKNVSQLAGRPIAGIAVVGGIFSKEDIVASTKELFQLVSNIVK